MPVALILYAIAMYIRLVITGEAIKEGWSAIEVQLKRRFNLIKNLANVVEDYAKHEVETLEKLTDASSAAFIDATAEHASAEGEIRSALVKMLSVTEAHPDVIADGSFRDMQQEIAI